MKKIVNRKAFHDYQLLENFEAGVILTGAEVKSIKEGRLNLSGSFVRVRGNEAWLHNAHISPYGYANMGDYDPSKPRKLLLHKKELLRIDQKMKEKKLTIMPVSCYIKANKIKLELALARGKREYEKREAARKRDLERELESSLTMKN